MVIWEKDKRRFGEKAENSFVDRQVHAAGEAEETELESEIVARFPEPSALQRDGPSRLVPLALNSSRRGSNPLFVDKQSVSSENYLLP